MGLYIKIELSNKHEKDLYETEYYYINIRNLLYDV